MSSAVITALFISIAIKIQLLIPFIILYLLSFSTVECRANDTDSMGDCKTVEGAATVTAIMGLYLLISNVLLLNLLIAKFK